MLPGYGYAAIPVAVAMGLVTGTISGLFHVWLKIPSFIVTLATSGLLVSAALLLSHERAISIDEAGPAHLNLVHGEFFGLPNRTLVASLSSGVGRGSHQHTAFSRLTIPI